MFFVLVPKFQTKVTAYYTLFSAVFLTKKRGRLLLITINSLKVFVKSDWKRFERRTGSFAAA